MKVIERSEEIDGIVYNLKYEHNPGDFHTHRWSVGSPIGGIHLWIYEDEENSSIIKSGGIEYHYAKQPDWESSDPSHEKCWLIDKPCWHDGSGLQAKQYWIPLWESDKNNHDRILQYLLDDTRSKFEVSE